eukprot:8967604-Pyramimonas_sp.AAC.1
MMPSAVKRTRDSALMVSWYWHMNFPVGVGPSGFSPNRLLYSVTIFTDESMQLSWSESHADLPCTFAAAYSLSAQGLHLGQYLLLAMSSIAFFLAHPMHVLNWGLAAPAPGLALALPLALPLHLALPLATACPLRAGRGDSRAGDGDAAAGQPRPPGPRLLFESGRRTGFRSSLDSPVACSSETLESACIAVALR